MGAVASSLAAESCSPKCEEVCNPKSTTPDGKPKKTKIDWGNEDVDTKASLDRLAQMIDFTKALAGGDFAKSGKRRGSPASANERRGSSASAKPESFSSSTDAGGGSPVSPLEARLRRGSSAAKTVHENLHTACGNGDLRRFKAALDAGVSLGVSLQELVNQKNARGLTPAMLAAASQSKSSCEILAMLIEHKADILAQDVSGWTAFLHACRNGQTETVKFLLEQGVDPTDLTADNQTSLMLALIEGKLDLVRLLVMQKTVASQIVCKDSHGWTSLHHCAKHGSFENAKLLLDQAASINAKDIDIKTPLAVACEFGNLDCVKYLIKKRAGVNDKDKEGRTPIMHAVLHDYEGVAMILLKAGADPFMRDLNGDTPLKVAGDAGLNSLKAIVKGQILADEQAE